MTHPEIIALLSVAVVSLLIWVFGLWLYARSWKSSYKFANGLLEKSHAREDHWKAGWERRDAEIERLRVLTGELQLQAVSELPPLPVPPEKPEFIGRKDCPACLNRASFEVYADGSGFCPRCSYGRLPLPVGPAKFSPAPVVGGAASDNAEPTGDAGAGDACGEG